MAKRAAIQTKKKAVVKKATAKKAVVPKKKQLTIMVSSTVYDSESDLDQIAAILGQQFGYKVIMSKEGSVYVSMKHVGDTKAACLQAVKDCDLFFGIIFPRYGSGITHAEFLEAKRLNKPRWFIAHEKIEFLRKLLQPKMYTKAGKRKKFEIPKTSVLDSVKVVDMYNDVRQNWVQSFRNMEGVRTFIETQFGDMKQRIKELEEIKKKKK
jgi:hypothetical protein